MEFQVFLFMGIIILTNIFMGSWNSQMNKNGGIAVSNEISGEYLESVNLEMQRVCFKH